MLKFKRISEDRFVVPILQVLVQMGGSGRTRDVLDEVKERMGLRIVPPKETQTLSSNEIRWRNTARWARHRMVKAGLLKAGTARGNWMITQSGRAYLVRPQDR
jgi:restriction system protein